MADVLSKNRKLLMRYLRTMGCHRSTIWQITMLDLELEEEILDMLQYCKENHPNVTEDSLLQASCEIAEKRVKGILNN